MECQIILYSSQTPHPNFFQGDTAYTLYSAQCINAKEYLTEPSEGRAEIVGSPAPIPVVCNMSVHAQKFLGGLL